MLHLHASPWGIMMSSPLADTWAALGAVFEDANELPAQFGDWQAEYRAATESVAIFDCSTMTKVELTGRDRSKFLHNLCTQDIKGLPVGRGREAFLTNVQGKVLHFVRVFADAESLWIDTVPGAAESLLADLDHYRISEKVEMADRSAGFAQLMLLGPKARESLVA